MTFGPRLFGRRGVWLAVPAVAIAALAAAFVSMPVALRSSDSGGRSAFAALASAAIVAIATLPFILWRGARPKTWMALGVVSLALGVGSFYAGASAQRACTAPYQGAAVLVGTQLTPLGTAYQQAHPDLSPTDLLFDAAGVPDRIWTPDSIDRCRALIGSTYFLWIPFLVICLLTAAQAIPVTLLSSPPAGAAPARPVTRTAARYDAFISYRHNSVDTNVARQLAAALEADGYGVAIDERDFPANASFLQEMERCVRESRFTVAVISPRYLDSGNCQEEAIICKVLDMGDRQRRLIPFIIEPVNMPAWLYGIVGIDCTKADPMVDPIDKLRATLGAPSRTSSST